MNEDEVNKQIEKAFPDLDTTQLIISTKKEVFDDIEKLKVAVFIDYDHVRDNYGIDDVEDSDGRYVRWVDIEKLMKKHLGDKQ